MKDIKKLEKELEELNTKLRNMSDSVFRSKAGRELYKKRNRLRTKLMKLKL